MQTLVSLLQRSYTRVADDDDGGTGTSAHSLRDLRRTIVAYVLTRCGNAKQLSGRTEEMLGADVAHLQRDRGRNGETASQPVIRQLLSLPTTTLTETGAHHGRVHGR